MPRKPVVTGGTRGVGVAIPKALNGGYKIASNYGGNDEAARFKAETGIPVYKWDVSSLKPRRRHQQVEADLGRSTSWSTMLASPAARSYIA